MKRVLKYWTVRDKFNSVHPDLDLLENLISLLGRKSKFGDSIGEVHFSLLGFLLHQHDSTTQSGNVGFNLLVHLVLLFIALISLVKFVKSLIKLNLKTMNFLSIISDVTLSLFKDSVGFFGLILKLLDDSPM